MTYTDFSLTLILLTCSHVIEVLSSHTIFYDSIDCSIFYSSISSKDLVTQLKYSSRLLSRSPEVAFLEITVGNLNSSRLFWDSSPRPVKEPQLALFLVQSPEEIKSLLHVLRNRTIEHVRLVNSVYYLIIFQPNSSKLIEQNPLRYFPADEVYLNDDIYFGSLSWNDPKTLDNTFTLHLFENYNVNGQTFTRQVYSLSTSPFDFFAQVEHIYVELLPKAGRRCNLRLAKITTTIASKPLEPYVDDNELLRERITPPWMKPVNKDLEFLMNFTNEFKSTSGGDHVHYLDEKDLSSKQAEFTAFSQTITVHKIKENMVVAVPAVFQKLYAFYLQEDLDHGTKLYEDKFKGMMWISFILTWVSILGSFVLIKKVFAVRSISLSLRDLYFLRDNLMWAVSFMSLRTWHNSPRKVSARIVFLFAGFFSLVFYVTYSSLIISAITTVKPKIQSFEDITRLKYDLTTYYQSLPLVTLINNTIKMENLKGYTVTGEEQIKHILNRKNRVAHITYIDCFIGEAGRQNYSKQFICNNFDKVFAARTSGGMIIRKGSQFREILNYKILEILEKGLVKRHLKYDDTLAWIDLCSSSRSYKHFHASNFDEFLPYLYVIIGGLVTGVSIMLVEQLYHKLQSYFPITDRKHSNSLTRTCKVKMNITVRGTIQVSHYIMSNFLGCMLSGKQ